MSAMAKEVFIVSGARTPIGRFMGGLSSLTATQLGAIAIKEAINRAKITPDKIQEVIMGNVLQAGVGQNPARQSAIYAGIPVEVPAYTVNKVCGSGLKAVMLAAQAIRAGDGDCIVAGGMESMSNAPYLMPDARRGARLGHAKLVDAMVFDGLTDIYSNMHMGYTCELVVERFGITRAQMDEFSLMSHKRAASATKEGRFKQEIVPVETVDAKKKPITISLDEGFREDTSIEKLAQLKPAFKEKGSVTAGNSSQISDGAAAVIVASDEFVKRENLTPFARIVGYATGGVEPKWVLVATKEALVNLDKVCGYNVHNVDLIEINEAFAGSTCALIKEMNINTDKLNINGGAVALGHPIGASGARVLVTLMYALRQKNLKKGIAALCLGGGNSVAMAIEMV
jgi:acetyl-CoA C-acetyltransferase